MKCFYLLVCLPAKMESGGIEETFQEPLTRVSGAPFPSRSDNSFIAPLTASVLRTSSFCCLSGSASALSAACQCGETGGNSGTAVSHHWPHISVGPDQSCLETPGLSRAQGSLCCSNKQHCPMFTRLYNIIFFTLFLIIKGIIRFSQECNFCRQLSLFLL